MDVRGAGRSSIYSQEGQRKLLGMRDENVRKLKSSIERLIDRANKAGCGLVMEMIPTKPGLANVSFFLSRKPTGRLYGHIDGGIIALRGMSWAEPIELKSMMNMIVRCLTLGDYDDPSAPPGAAPDAKPAVSSPSLDAEPKRAADPAPTETKLRGFIREISID